MAYQVLCVNIISILRNIIIQKLSFKTKLILFKICTLLTSATTIFFLFQKYLLFTLLFIVPNVKCESYQGDPLDPKNRKTSQYHIHKDDGQYEYGYNTGNSAKYEIKTSDGITKGAYSYSDPNNVLRVTNYVSDIQNGYRARNSKHGKERNIWERLGLEGTHFSISECVNGFL